MINDFNIANSAIKVFEILKKLYFSDCLKNDLINDFSDDSLTLYLNTLRKAGFVISSPRKNSKYYKLKSFDYFTITENDAELLLQLKNILSYYNSYKDIIDFNNFINKLAKYSDKKSQIILDKILFAKPFSINFHSMIVEFEKFIENKTPVLIKYDTTNSKNNSFKILPQYLKLQNSKMYLFGEDKTLEDLRCLKLDKIIKYKPLNEKFLSNYNNNIAVCKFLNKDISLVGIFENYEIVKNSTDYIIAKIQYYNIFEFVQKILYLSNECEVLEPIELRNKIIQKIDKIKVKYVC